jgi:hypothetical protein
MTTREEYAEAAEWHQEESEYHRKLSDSLQGADRDSCLGVSKYEELAARVLRQLAEGAVLCDKVEHEHETWLGNIYMKTTYVPIKEQP